MLIQLLKKAQIPFDYKTYERLVCLETHLRQSSTKKWKLEEYAEWLETAGINVPVNKTLRIDLKIYSEMCDDILNPKSAKIIQLNEKATDDAVSYLLGHAWLHSPLKPKIYSSTVRCILLAMLLKKEISFQYHKLDLSNFDEYTTTFQKGIPVQLVPGTDSGYFLLWIKDAKNIDRLININIARIFPNSMTFTNSSDEDIFNQYVNRPESSTRKIQMVEDENYLVLKRLQRQFEGIEVDEINHSGKIDVPNYLDLMIRDLLVSFAYRTYHRKLATIENRKGTPIDFKEIAQKGLPIAKDV